LYQFSNITNYVNCKIAINNQSNKPEFKDVNKNDFKLLLGSVAIGNANFSNSIFADIVNKPRTNPSDIGAYKFVP
jgi:hypothetical protein